MQTEGERQLRLARAFGDNEVTFIALPLVSDGAVLASVIDRRHVRIGTAVSFLNCPQVCFGLMESVIGGVPLMSMLYMRAYL